MTKKSISDICEELQAAGKLSKFQPVGVPDMPEVRRLLLARPVENFIVGTYGRRTRQDYYANVRAFLGLFVAGAKMVHNVDFRRLDPQDKYVWEMRVRLDPQSRIFGAFLITDCYVGLRAKFRDDSGTLYKGKKGFDRAIEDVERDWDKLFGGIPRLGSFPLSNCITGAIEDD